MEVPDGHLSTDQPVWQDLLHGLANLTAAQGNYGGDGYATRYSFGLSQNVVTTSVNAQSDLVMLAGEPLVGSRPKWTPGHQPPYRARRALRDAADRQERRVRDRACAAGVAHDQAQADRRVDRASSCTDRLRKSLKVLKKAESR